MLQSTKATGIRNARLKREEKTGKRVDQIFHTIYGCQKGKRGREGKKKLQKGGGT
jgi:hypothetical protein